MFRRRLIDGGLVALFVLAGAASLVATSEPPREAGAGKPLTHTVEIRGFQFLPAEVRVKRGDTILWINHDLAPHTATANDSSWDSAKLTNGQRWSRTMQEAGRTAYICAYHPAMKGVVIVE